METKNNIDSPQVDVLVISYNQEKIIHETIESVLNQTYHNTKLIIADDCSTDSTRDIIDGYHRKYPDKIIKIYNEQNMGITKNSNIGLAACKGDYFIIMGGDDVLYPNKVEEQVKWFNENTDCGLCGHNLDMINDQSEKISETNYSIKGKGAKNWIKYGMLCGCMSIMVKRKLNPDITFDERLIYSSDLKFFIDFLRDDIKYGCLPDRLGAYRKSVNSITNQKWEACVNDSKNMYSILPSELGSKHRKNIEFGLTFLIDYGKALRNMNTGNKKEAVKGFTKVSLKYPLFMKSHIRLIQSIIK